MKKIILIVLVLFLTACSDDSNQNDAYFETYNGLYKALLDNEQYLTSSFYYDLTLEVSKLNDNQFRYYLILDNPQVSMYDVQLMACDTTKLTVDSDVMCPSVGVFEKERYTLIPNQINREKNYVKGFSLSGISESSNIDINVIIKWNSKDLTDSYQEMININSTKLEKVVLTSNILNKIDNGTLNDFEDENLNQVEEEINNSISGSEENQVNE